MLFRRRKWYFLYLVLFHMLIITEEKLRAEENQNIQNYNSRKKAIENKQREQQEQASFQEELEKALSEEIAAAFYDEMEE